MIGYYVHHVGRGHLTRALALAAALDDEVTGLSSLPRPEGWHQRWVELPRDDVGTAPDPTAAGHLHWAPLQHAGHRTRTARISAWIDEQRPSVLVSDVSVEVSLLARLHGVPVVSVVLPGERGDPAHLLGYGVSAALVGFWPAGVQDVVRGLPDDLRARVQPLGALSRFSHDQAAPVTGRTRRVTVLLGAGGHDVDDGALAAARRSSPGWTWTVLDPATDDGTRDVAAALSRSTVVVMHAGESAVAEVASLRRPAIVVPQQRPHDEQRCTASVLAGGGWPALVEGRLPHEGWDALLDRAARLDGSGWDRWCDGGAAERFAAVVRDTVAHSGASP